MATTTIFISLEDYLRTSYHPDCDYVDDHIEERNLGEFEHARLQTVLSSWFFANESAWNVLAVVEQRIRVTPTRVRIADICLVAGDAPDEKVTLTPPLLCVEILSPEDRLPHAAQVFEDYRGMGVQNLWLLDPIRQIAYIYTSEGNFQVVMDRLTIPSTPIYVDLKSLFLSAGWRAEPHTLLKPEA